MRTFYGLVPTLTRTSIKPDGVTPVLDGQRADGYTPVRIQLVPETETFLRDSLGRIRELLPSDINSPAGERLLGISDQVTVLGSLPENRRIPEGIFIRVGINFGLLAENRTIPSPPRLDSKKFGRADIVTRVFKRQPLGNPPVIVRDKLLRTTADGQVVFTPEFLQDSLSVGTAVDLRSMVARRHRPSLVDSLFYLVRVKEGGWLKSLSNLDGGETLQKLLKPNSETTPLSIMRATLHLNERCKNQTLPEGNGSASKETI